MRYLLKDFRTLSLATSNLGQFSSKRRREIAKAKVYAHTDAGAELPPPPRGQDDDNDIIKGSNYYLIRFLNDYIDSKKAMAAS